MPDSYLPDYSALDRPEVLSMLFHPRKQRPLIKTTPNCQDVLIPVDDNIRVGARFHLADNPIASILFFHGNGEIAADYDELGPFYTGMGMNFFVADYRGYGRSDGHPTVTAMLSDCHKILNHVNQYLSDRKDTSPLIVMGRSLGSASALELAHSHSDVLKGLIIESGFADAGPLLQRLGVSVERTWLKEEKGFANIDKIRTVAEPTLIIHAEFDHIIPFSDGQKLFDSSAASSKNLLKIPNADHNNIIAVGLQQYMAAIKILSQRV